MPKGDALSERFSKDENAYTDGSHRLHGSQYRGECGAYVFNGAYQCQIRYYGRYQCQHHRVSRGLSGRDGLYSDSCHCHSGEKKDSAKKENIECHFQPLHFKGFQLTDGDQIERVAQSREQNDKNTQ